MPILRAVEMNLYLHVTVVMGKQNPGLGLQSCLQIDSEPASVFPLSFLHPLSESSYETFALLALIPLHGIPPSLPPFLHIHILLILLYPGEMLLLLLENFIYITFMTHSLCYNNLYSWKTFSSPVSGTEFKRLGSGKETSRKSLLPWRPLWTGC